MKPTDNRILGSSGLSVTRLGLGCAAIGGLYGDISDDQATTVVKKALSLGLNLFDTAPLYGLGKSEQRLGEGLKNTNRESYILASKVGRILEPNNGQKNDSIFENEPPLKIKFDYSYDGVMRSLDSSRERLGVDRIDIVHIHDPDDHWKEAIEGAYPALEKLRAEGAISAISAGMNQWQMLSRFACEGDFDCFLLAGRYSLLDQTAVHELLPLCLEKNIGIMAGGTYNSGILAKGAKPGATYNYSEAPTDIVQKASAIEAVAERHNVNIKAAASQFVFAHPAITSIIPGTRQPERVEENFNLITENIPTDFWQELRYQDLLDPAAPLPT